MWNTATRKELVVCTAGKLTSYDPSTGVEPWTLSGIPSSFSASPVADREHVYFGNSGPFSHGPLLAVRAGNSGESNLVPEMETPGVAWSKLKSGPGMASPVLTAGCLYVPGSGRILTCCDTATGECIDRDRLPEAGTIASLLWACGDHSFILDRTREFMSEAPAPHSGPVQNPAAHTESEPLPGAVPGG